MTIVNDRTAGTLFPIIQAHIRPGTTIFSDEWSAYRGISSIAGSGLHIRQLITHKTSQTLYQVRTKMTENITFYFDGTHPEC